MNALISEMLYQTPAPPKIPLGRRIYCIGDIHGREDLLLKLATLMTEDTAGYLGKKQVVFLGDYIDRGMHSKQVLDTLTDNGFLPGFEKIFLKGNHEHTLLEFLYNDSSVLKDWWRFGAQTFFYSYGLVIPGIPSESSYAKLRAELKAALPIAHLHFLQQLKPSFTLGDYFFAHAGIKPGIDLRHQHSKDLYWIRDEFLASSQMHEKVVVHGHTITPEPTVLPNRIGIDTGAYASGKLTCLILENGTQRIINNLSSLEPEQQPTPDTMKKRPAPIETGKHDQAALTHLLKLFMARSPGLSALALLSNQGEVIAECLPEPIHKAEITNMSSRLLTIAKQATAQLQQGSVKQLIVTAEHGYLVLIDTGADSVLLAVIKESLKLGQILFDLREIIKELYQPNHNLSS